MSVSASQRQIVSSLPRQLLSFFKRHPPASATSWHPVTSTDTSSPESGRIQNPFLPSRNKFTQKFNEPRYSIRRQTDLYNLAKLHAVEHLLPPRAQHKEEKVGAVMKGLKKWKGTKMERTRDARIQAIKVKTVAARKIVKAKKLRTKEKKRKQRKSGPRLQ